MVDEFKEGIHDWRAKKRLLLFFMKLGGRLGQAAYEDLRASNKKYVQFRIYDKLI